MLETLLDKARVKLEGRDHKTFMESENGHYYKEFCQGQSPNDEGVFRNYILCIQNTLSNVIKSVFWLDAEMRTDLVKELMPIVSQMKVDLKEFSQTQRKITSAIKVNRDDTYTIKELSEIVKYYDKLSKWQEI